MTQPMSDADEFPSYEQVQQQERVALNKGNMVIGSLKKVYNDLTPLMVYKADFGIIVEDTFVVPKRVAPSTVDNARLQAHNLGLKATATLELIRKLMLRVTRDEIPAAQRAKFRHAVLSKRNKQTKSVTEKMKSDRKKHVDEQRAQVATLDKPEEYQIEDLEQEFEMDEPDLS